MCFKCDAKWFKTHKCPNKALQLLTVINGFELEVLDENMGRYVDEENDQVEDGPAEKQECMHLSLHSFLGISSPTTTKLIG